MCLSKNKIFHFISFRVFKMFDDLLFMNNIFFDYFDDHEFDLNNSKKIIFLFDNENLILFFEFDDIQNMKKTKIIEFKIINSFTFVVDS